MRQKGFATIFGLCMILAFALIVKGINEAEMNHAYEAADFQAEVEVQDAADSGIYLAAERVLANPDLLPKVLNPSVWNARQNSQVKVLTTSVNKITVEVWGERMQIQPYKVKYNDNSATTDSTTKNVASKDGTGREAYVFFSRASIKAKHMNGKIYRRAHAYIFADDTNATIHFLELKMSPYKLKS